MLKIYGASDDLVEIEGSKYKDDEIGCYNQDVIIDFTDGTQILVGYSKPGLGVWYIQMRKTGKAEYHLSICQNEDAYPYSDVLEIDSEIKSHRLVKKSKER